MSDKLTGQKRRLLEYLQTHGEINPIEALSRLSIYRLSEVVRKLREEYVIETVMIPHTNKYGEKGSYGKYVYKGQKKNING